MESATDDAVDVLFLILFLQCSHCIVDKALEVDVTLEQSEVVRPRALVRQIGQVRRSRGEVWVLSGSSWYP
ncbi:MAG: hypothetical protein ACFFDV_12030 [Candidatus Thorarchaeota archaeon]